MDNIKNIKIEAYKEITGKIKEQFQLAYTDGFYKTLENQINAILDEMVGDAE